MSNRTRFGIALTVVLLLVVAVGGVADAQSARTRIGWLIAERLDVIGDQTVGDDLTVTDLITSADVTTTDDVVVGDDLTVTDDMTVDAVTAGNITQVINSAENVGLLPTVVSASVEYTTTAGLFTIADGEIWVVHGVLVNVTTNYDCTGDNCTFQIGDGNDANGLVDLVDAEIQAADTEGTGWAAGWQGQLAATKGAYLVDSDFVYAPSGAAETIDFAVGGTDPAGGAATVYVIYTRIQ